MLEMRSTTDTAQRLSPTDLAAWAGFLRVHATVSQALDAELTAQHGITLSDYDVLVFLANAPQRRLRMSELAESVLISQSGITRLVDRLAARGYVERVKCPEDKRGAFAVLTNRGLRTLAAANGAHIASVRARFLDHLDDDQKACMAANWERILPDVLETFRRLAPPQD